MFNRTFFLALLVASMPLAAAPGAADLRSSAAGSQRGQS